MVEIRVAKKESLGISLAAQTILLIGTSLQTCLSRGIQADMRYVSKTPDVQIRK
jgi:hypothetical protein